MNMTFKYAAPAVSVALLLSGTSAFAQVTAQQVWDDWKANFGIYGDQGVTVESEETVDGVLTVTNLTLDLSSEGSEGSLTVPWITFTELGDGSVSIETAEESPIEFTFTNDDGTTGSVSMALRQSELELLASGTPEDMTYDLSATRYGIDLVSVVDDGAEIPVTASIALNEVGGTYTVATADMRAITYAVTAGTMDVVVDATNPDDGSAFKMTGRVKNIETNVDMVVPLPENTTPETILMDGLATTGSYAFGGSSFDFTVTDPSTGDTTGNATAKDGGVLFAVSAESLGYSSSATSIAVNLNSAMMPIPVTISLAEYGIDFLMPMSKSEEPQDFGLGVNLTDLSLNEEIWGMIDTGAVLPHDPATILLDLTGTAKLLFDLTDPAQAEAMAAAAAPGEINSVSLNNLLIKLAGAEVSGTGAFTFDNSDMMTIPGMPRPEGKIDIAASGVNGLMGKLVQMGLLPQDQATMGQMMLGMFSVATGDDQLTSTIEVTNGKILANGQPLN
ncbi:MAG: hypothetical protein NTX73_18770 [Rhodobacterales bacterium]|nr:hypothetical protein [Rhodobacterales bacterium]